MSTPKRYLTPEVYQALAPQYVSGLLRGKARARFAYLMHRHDEIRSAVRDWEQHLDGLNEHLSEVEPDEFVLQNIQQRIEPKKQSMTSATGFFEDLKHWCSQWWLGSGGLVASLLLASVLLWQNTQEPILVNYVAVMENSAGDAQWIATSSKVTRKLKIERLVDAQTTDKDKQFVVWAISKEDGSFYRFGEVTSAEQRWITLNDEAWKQIKLAKSLIITEESHLVNAPTGPVVAKGLCVQINYQNKKSA